MKILAAILAAASLLPSVAHAQVEVRTRQQLNALGRCQSPGWQVLRNEEGLRVEKAKEDFEALGFGGGYGGVFGLGDSRIQEAEVIGGIVRVKDDDDVQFGPVLELHKFIKPLKSEQLVKVGNDWVLAEDMPDGCVPTGAVVKTVPLWSMGPFVALRLGSDETIIQSFGGGLVFGFREAENDTSLNLGLAFVWDPSVQVLGDGIEANKPLPSGETEIRYRTTNKVGILAMFSVGW